MLTEDQQTLVRRCAARPALGTAAGFSLLLVVVAFAACELLGAGVFGRQDAYAPGRIVCAALAAVLLVVWAVVRLWSGRTARGEAWEGVRYAARVRAGLDEDEEFAPGRSLRREALDIARLFDVEAPRTRAGVCAVLLVPLVLVVAVYAPSFASSAQQDAEQQEVAAEAVEEALAEVLATFEAELPYAYASDPDSSTSGLYAATGYLYELSDDNDSRVRANFDSSGAFTGLTYYLDVDVTLDMEEAVAQAAEELAQLNAVVQESVLGEEYPEVAAVDAVDEALWDELRDGGFYDTDIEWSGAGEGYSVYAYYYTVAEDDFDESCDPYVSLSVDVA